MIKFQNVEKSFNGLNVLKNISFEIKTDELAAVLGPSGSGKTTLLRLMAGTLKPDGGTIAVDSPRIGFIFQDHRLLPWRTAQDNIALVLRAAGKSKEEARKKARDWMDRLGLEGFYDYYPGQLSGGMMQRVSIARAFAIEPEIMLMDEPFSSLDAGLADALLKDLKQVLREYRATTVYVTHDPLEAISLAERIFHLTPAGFEENAVTDRKTMLREYLTGRLKEIEPGLGAYREGI